jgi:hypothetical protein
LSGCSCAQIRLIKYWPRCRRGAIPEIPRSAARSLKQWKLAQWTWSRGAVGRTRARRNHVATRTTSAVVGDPRRR